MDRRWRKESVRDWRRRSGFVSVEVVSGVECVVKVVRGYVSQVQVIGSVRDVDGLGRVAEFLDMVFGVKVAEDDLISVPSIPKPDPNRLKSLSWGVIRRAKPEWIPITGFGRWLSDQIVNKLDRDTWLEIVSAPRVGKSSGTLLGLMRWVVERDEDNYVVLVVVVNRRIGRQLYKYLLGGWRRLLKDLRELGWNAGMLAEKIRIRYYEGMEFGCLLNKRIHKFEECLKCPLFELYQKEWRRVYRFPVPVMDPVILKMSGFCPFQVLFSSSFWRNSFVVIHYRILPLVVSILSRLGIKKIVIYLDEYLEHLKSRLCMKKIDVRRFSKDVLNLGVEIDGRVMRFSQVVNMYNNLIDSIIRRIFTYFLELDVKNLSEFKEFIRNLLLGEINIDYDVVKSIYDDVKRLVYLLDLFYEKYRLSVFRRFRRYISFCFSSFFRVEFRRGEVRRVFSPEIFDGSVYSAFGGYVYSFFARLYSLGKEVYIVSSSVEDSNFSILRVKLISPCDKLRYKRLSIVYYRGVIKYPFVNLVKDPDHRFRYVKSLRTLFSILKSGKRNIAVVLDKESMLILGKEFERIGWEVEYGRDSENPDVVDYVVVRRPDDSIILMFHPHGRTSMGVDPPFKDRIESVIVALGLRGYPRYVVPVPSNVRRYVSDWDGSVISLDDLGGVYCVLRGGLLYVYDVFSFKYDYHLLIQTVGRFFLSSSMRFICVNPRFGIGNIRFFLFVHYLDLGKVRLDVGKIFRVRFRDNHGRLYDSEFEVLVRRGSLLGVKSVPEEVDISIFSKNVNNVYVVNLRKVRFNMFNRLRNVYNSLRYVKIQLRYGHKPNKWWLIKKFVVLINGFEFARLSNLNVPTGLRRIYRTYCEYGLGSLLEYVKDRYLREVDSETWDFVLKYVERFTGIKLKGIDISGFGVIKDLTEFISGVGV